MNSLMAILCFLVVVPLILVLLFSTSKPQVQPTGSFGVRRPLSRAEQTMYWRLVQAFPSPEFVVLAQVSLGALLVAVGLARESNFNERRADFVLLDRAFRVLGVIELLDKARSEKELKDDERNKMLKRAGYRVVRYRGLPDKERLLKDLRPSSA
jgi:very-short-patch-repair endonuclease